MISLLPFGHGNVYYIYKLLYNTRWFKEKTDTSAPKYGSSLHKLLIRQRIVSTEELTGSVIECEIIT